MKEYRTSIEMQINNSNVFQLEPGTVGYRREAMKLIELMFMYLMEIGRSKYEEYAVEVTETAKRCIKNYNAGTGSFLNYFNAAWKLEYRRALGKTLIADSYAGVKFPDAIQRKLRSYFKYVNSMGGNSETMEVEENASHALGLSIVEYRELVAIIKSRTISENAQGAEGDECSLFDGLKAKEIVDEELMELETMQAILDAIEMNYCNLRERRKPFFRDLITLKISGLFAEDERTIRMLCKKEFFNKELYTKCVDGSITARYIAEQYSIKEQSVSRAWKKFKKKVAYNIKG